MAAATLPPRLTSATGVPSEKKGMSRRLSVARGCWRQLELEEGEEPNNEAAAPFWGFRPPAIHPDSGYPSLLLFFFLFLTVLALVPVPLLKVDFISVACNYKAPCPG